MFVIQNISLHILASSPPDHRWQGQLKKALNGTYWHQDPPRVIGKIGGKTKLKCNERLKKIPMMTRKKILL